jgi:hypothetical protein
MIFGSILIGITLIIYYCYYPKLPPKGSLGYYKQEWRYISNIYNK